MNERMREYKLNLTRLSLRECENKSLMNISKKMRDQQLHERMREYKLNEYKLLGLTRLSTNTAPFLGFRIEGLGFRVWGSCSGI